MDWKPSEHEKKILEKAFLKILKPTIESITRITSKGTFKSNLLYEDTKGVAKTEPIDIELLSDNEPGIKFKISLPEILNIGSVLYKESYGLTKELQLKNQETNLVIPENSVIKFKTIFPAKPQVLEGRFKRAIIRSSKNAETSYCRMVIPTDDTEMIYPSSIMEYGENHMKFDNPDWDRQSTLMGFPFMSTKGMFVKLNIRGCSFHFYGLEQANSLIIDSLDEISISGFKTISYAIRLCFAFLSGKFYNLETYLVTSNHSDFKEITSVEYNKGEHSIITENQIINPTFFFSQYSEKDKEIQQKWRKYHKMFDPNIFSAICDKILSSAEFLRSIELIVNAGNIHNPIQKGAMYSVCIETLTELIKSENVESFKPIPEKQIWQEFRLNLISELEKIKTKVNDEGYSILTAKINNLNGPTNREKLEKPFKHVGIELTQKELDILAQRNDYLHGGHPDDNNWIVQTNLNALKLHYVIGWLILKYFKYSGHYINISSWYILNDLESKKIMENIDFSEIEKVIKKIKNKDFQSKKELDDAKQTIDKLDKFNKAAAELSELIKII